MLKRYTKEGMGEIWSEENKFRNWLLVELTVLEVRHSLGEIPHEVPKNLINEIVINTDEINRIEEDTKHDVVAFLKHVSPQFPKKLRPWLHRGLTSYDIGDTTLSLQMRSSIEELLESLNIFMHTIKLLALENKHTPEVGRTHGIHAEPITFGVKLANWYAELQRSGIRLMRLIETVSVGKISGAVGMYTLDPRIEEEVCEELGLKPVIATQIIARDIIAEYMSTLAILGASVGKIALNIRLLSMTEVGEIMEPFSKDQKGSSAMPHKKNPIQSENVSSLGRVIHNNPNVAFVNLESCWHERSLDNSAAERVIIADSSIALDFILRRIARIVMDMRVFPEKMMHNLNLTKSLIFSQDVMMLIAEKSGLPREEAHTLVRDVAIDCWEKGTNFQNALFANEKIMSLVSNEELMACFDVNKKIKHVDHIFEQVFGK
jgi:adenylosuccinate lyase